MGVVDQDRLVVGYHVAGRRGQWRTGREPARRGGVVAHRVEIAGAVGPGLHRDHLEGIDREKLAQGGVEPGQHAGLVERRGHGPRDAVQRLQAAGLVAGQLVQRGVGEQHAQPAVHVFQELDLRGRHPPLAVRVIDHAADQLALVLHRHPDGHLASSPYARTLADHEPGMRLDRQNGGFRVGELPCVHRLAHRPPDDVLQHTRVHRQGVVPAFAFEDLKVDRVIPETALEPAIEDLHDVGLGHACAQLMDQGVDGRAGRAPHALPGNRRRASRSSLDSGR